MRILLFGKDGQIGWELQRALAPLGEVLAVDRSQVDFMDLKGLRKFTLEARPDLIVNAAAYTAVDKAESEPEIAMRVNGQAPGVLAEVAKKLDAGLVHYSTDYVFDGTKREPYTEQDEPRPINIYGRTKLAGDRAIQNIGGKHLILRTSWVYGARGQNFYRTIIRLAKERQELRIVNDQIGCPTWCRAIANATCELLASKLLGERQGLDTFFDEFGGLYNYAARGEVSWYGFAREIQKRYPEQEVLRTNSLEPIPSSEYPTPAVRPRYSVLSKHVIEKTFDLSVSPWEAQLLDCIEEQGVPATR